MKFTKYLRDKLLFIILFLIMYFIIILMLLAFKVPASLITAITITIFFFYIVFILLNYFKKCNFYKTLFTNIKRLDKSYLVLETMTEPSFYEGKLVYEALYDINKSMSENVKTFELQMNDFKEYIEMWIHEVKIPIATLTLLVHNNKDKFDKNFLEQLKRLDNYTEQVLYYVRSENAEKDYLITENNLDKIISNTLLKNKEDILENKIDLYIRPTNLKVLTDGKWCEFILNQIINNSIKYKKEKNAYIKINALEQDNKIILKIKDNGIGIPASDITKVFQKSFTGYNGRIKAKSTGMGLYIAKKSCEKLGHQIKINSIQNEYTEVEIIFSNDKTYKIMK